MALALSSGEAAITLDDDDRWLFDMAATMEEPTPGLDALKASLDMAIGGQATIVAEDAHAELQAIRGAMVAELLHQGQIRIRNPDMLAAIVARLSAKQPRMGRLTALIGFFQAVVDTGDGEAAATKV